jgi:hypothetical protein
MGSESPLCQKYDCYLPAVIRYSVLAGAQNGDQDEIWKRDACQLHAEEARYKSNRFIGRPDLRYWRLSLAIRDLRTES